VRFAIPQDIQNERTLYYRSTDKSDVHFEKLLLIYERTFCDTLIDKTNVRFVIPG